MKQKNKGKQKQKMSIHSNEKMEMVKPLNETKNDMPINKHKIWINNKNKGFGG